MAGQSRQGDNRRPSAKKSERHSAKKPERANRKSGTRPVERRSKHPVKLREDHRSENKPERTNRKSGTHPVERRSKHPVKLREDHRSENKPERTNRKSGTHPVERRSKHPERKQRDINQEKIDENSPIQRKKQSNSQKSTLSVIGGITKNVVKAGIRVLGDVGEYIAENQENYEYAEARKRQRIRAISQNERNNQSIRVVRPDNTIIILEREPKKVINLPVKPKIPQPAVIEVLGGTFDKHPKKVNKTATGEILGGKYLR